MNNTKKIASVLILFLGALFYSSCETIDMDIKVDPNALSVDKADVDFYLNGVQRSFALNMQSYGRTSMEVTRTTNMFGRSYENAYSPATLDNKWATSFQDVLKNIQLMNIKAEEKGLKRHLAIGQIIEAYTIVNLVDYFGDIPYTEALAGASNLSPKLDSGASVYNAALVLLDKAIGNLSGTSPTTTTFNDFYYNKDYTKWIKLANSIKMKIYLQRRLVDPTAIASFNTIVATGNFMQSASEDFQFDWNSNVNNPDGRSPLFRDNYLTTGTSEYQSNWFMNLMLTDKSIPDPRMKYYFYRQVNGSAPVDPTTLKCSIEPAPQHYIDGNYTYCVLPNGYWGRDHGDNFGVPPDADKKTAYGVYPAGGRFDDNTYKTVSNLSGAKGDGITPILLSSTMDFYRAEAALFTGGVGSAKAFILAGVQKSFTKVRAFGARDTGANLTTAPALTRDVTYLNEVGTAFDAATVTGQKEILAKELFISLFGNGTDAYNFYRRTGFPQRIQPNLEPNPGSFIRSFLYPANETGSNSNVTQKTTVGIRVFWDNNPTTGFPIGN
jgi:hypothetical protein